MPRPIEEITTKHEKGPGNETTEVQSHPAFGQISLSRSSGGSGALYGSDFDHHHRITLRVSTSTVRHRSGTDWYHGSHFADILELDMSEAQFATFITSANMGEGSPCTLRSIQNRAIPDLPRPRSRTDQFGAEMIKIVQESLDRLQGITDKIDEMNLPKTKAAALKHEVRVAHDLLKSNTPYIAGRFDEHMEVTVEKAKMEVQGFMAGMAQAAGLDALAGSAAPITLLSGPEDSE